jgi:hypothetical protein
MAPCREQGNHSSGESAAGDPLFATMANLST